jgi:hypothetical protein
MRQEGLELRKADYEGGEFPTSTNCYEYYFKIDMIKSIFDYIG